MKSSFPRAFYRAFATFALLSLPWIVWPPLVTSRSQRAPARLALVGARIYPSPSEPPIPNGVVLIEDGRVAAVGPKRSVRIPRDAVVLDCAGGVVTAGFWNSHVHFAELKWENAAAIPAPRLAQQLQEMLTRYGFTTVFDTGSFLENTRAIQKRIESGEVPGPRIFTTGEILFPKGGAPGPELAKSYGFIAGEMPEVDTPRQAAQIARQKLDAGADAIKIYAATWRPPIVKMPLGVIRAVAAETHRRRKLVLAHPSSTEGLEASIKGGVDILVHTAPKSGLWNQTLVARMKAADIALIPTLKLWKFESRDMAPSDSEKFVNQGVAQLRAYAQAGGQILFGTDVGYISDSDPADEYGLMAQAGMTFPQILASLTTAPAERFGQPRRTGRIMPDMDADIVVLNADPARDVRGFARVRYTLRGGRLIYRGQ